LNSTLDIINRDTGKNLANEPQSQLRHHVLTSDLDALQDISKNVTRLVLVVG
ncbi:MAG: hypothetical protein IZT58_16950, partial [Actinobacteria bacterium]|nr:hypothetical protein [Actinomycetota bacterium]